MRLHQRTQATTHGTPRSALTNSNASATPILGTGRCPLCLLHLCMHEACDTLENRLEL